MMEILNITTGPSDLNHWLVILSATSDDWLQSIDFLAKMFIFLEILINTLYSHLLRSTNLLGQFKFFGEFFDLFPKFLNFEFIDQEIRIIGNGSDHRNACCSNTGSIARKVLSQVNECWICGKICSHEQAQPFGSMG